MDLLVAALPFLVLLACPLMMVFCVLGMRRMGGGADAGAISATGTTEERVTQLQHQLLAAQAELETLRIDAARPRQSEPAAPAERPAVADPAPAIRSVA